MGTDIYLRWKEQSTEERSSQYTGFQTNGGVGYLRASIGSVRENQMLRILFPEDVWFGEGDLGEPYNFIENKHLLEKALSFYINGTDEEDTMTESMKEQMKMGISIIYMFSQLKFDVAVPGMNRDTAYRQSFVDEVKSFYALGTSLNKQGIETYVYISW